MTDEMEAERFETELRAPIPGLTRPESAARQRRESEMAAFVQAQSASGEG